MLSSQKKSAMDSGPNRKGRLFNGCPPGEVFIVASLPTRLSFIGFRSLLSTVAEDGSLNGVNYPTVHASISRW